MTRVSPYQLSTHAVVRALERTYLSPGTLLDRIDDNAVAWLPARLPEHHRHALVYCAHTASYVVAILHETDRVLKTVVTLEQWENMYWKLADIWLALARHAAAQYLLALGPPAPMAEPQAPSGESGTSEGAPRAAPEQALDLRMVVKIDGPKGPKYQTLLEKTEAQWGAMMGSTPAERRRIQLGFFSKLSKRLLGVTAFAQEVCNRLEKHATLVVESDNVLLVFGPTSYGVQFLPQVDISRQLPALADRLALQAEKRAARTTLKKQRKRQKWLEQNHPSLVNSSMSAENKSLFALLVDPPAGM